MVPEEIKTWLCAVPNEVRDSSIALRARCDRNGNGIPPLRLQLDTTPEHWLEELEDWLEEHRPPSVRLAFLNGANEETKGFSKGFKLPADLVVPDPKPPTVIDQQPVAAPPRSQASGVRDAIFTAAQERAQAGDSSLLIMIYAMEQVTQVNNQALSRMEAVADRTLKSSEEISRSVSGLVQAQGRSVEAAHLTTQRIAVASAEARNDMSATLFNAYQEVSTDARDQAAAAALAQSKHPPAQPQPPNPFEGIARVIEASKDSGAVEGITKVLKSSVSAKKLPKPLVDLVKGMSEEDRMVLGALLQEALAA